MDADNNGESGKMARESRQMLQLLPEELWRDVFDQLKDTQDKLALINSSPFFRHLYQGSRVASLFPLIWPIINTKYHGCRQDPTSSPLIPQGPDPNARRLCLICRKDSPSWWYSFVLTVRQVCKSWNITVGEFQQGTAVVMIDVPRTNLHGKALVCSTKKSFNLHFFTNNQSNGYQAFFEHFQSQSVAVRNPFAITDIFIAMDENTIPDPEQFQDPRQAGFYRFLTFLSSHIRYIDICRRPFTRNSYLKLREILGILQNLTKIQVCYSYSGLERINVLLAEVEISPLPTLRNLQSLNVQSCPYPILNELLDKNNRISKLYHYHTPINEHTKIHLIPFPNLTEFIVSFNKIKAFRLLINPTVNWKLQKLVLNLEFCNDWPYLSHREIFSTLGKFAETLKFLILHSPRLPSEYERIRPIGEGASLRLNLPNLKGFMITTYNLTCLDFLITLKSLDLLKVNLIYTDPRFRSVDDLIQNAYLAAIESKSLLKLRRYSGRLLKSNIWTLLPKLNSLKFSNGFRVEGQLDYTFFKEECSRKEWVAMKIKQ